MSEEQLLQVGESSRTMSDGTVSVPRNPQRKSSSAIGLLIRDVKKILDSQGLYWNWIFFGIYVISISLDSSFFYILVIDGYRKCLSLVMNLAIALVVFRSLFDFFHVIYVIFETDSNVSGCIPNTRWAVFRRKYMPLINALVSILPIPLMVLFIVVPKMRGLKFETAMNWLKYLILVQYVPRAIRTYQLFAKAKNGAGVFAVILANAAFSFLLFLIVSHGFGALWYFFAIERVIMCWRKACEIAGCSHVSFYCNDNFEGCRILLNDFCSIKTRDPTVFYFGMFHEALQTGILEVTNLPQKFLYCFRLGIRSLCGSRIVWIILLVENCCSDRMRQFFTNIGMIIYLSIPHSSFAQNSETSPNLWERLFSLIMTISGAVLIFSLYTNVKKLLQYDQEISVRIRSQMLEIEQWSLFPLISNDLQQEVRNYHQTVWQATEVFTVHQFFNDLPRDISRKIKCQLCSRVLENVFEWIDEQFLCAMLDLLKLVTYTEGRILVHEGLRVRKMFFIVHGKMRSETTIIGNGGNFCGEEILSRGSVPPFSTRTVTADTLVEAFVIEANDWKELDNSLMQPDDQLPYKFSSRTFSSTPQAAISLHINHQL